ncbi:MAG: hypothetical protein H0T92_07245, partial [Pyrinomonadaceae bacterium]|nr:hypothetical protein [Pyrinomonadaceae bacterium]
MTRSRRPGDHRPGHKRSHKRSHAPERGTHTPPSASNPSEMNVNTVKPIARSRQVRRLLEGIGTPLPAPFAPDQFQLEALARVEQEDVLVTAPTGSGKTWIAREEIRRLLAAGRRAWYTSPL